MEKYEFKYDEKAVDEFINSLKKEPLLKGFDINVSNANMYYKVLCEKKNCKNCVSLKDCKNETKGYYNEVESSYGVAFLKAHMCPYLIENRKNDTENNLIKTLFMPKSVLEASLDHFNLDTERRTFSYRYALEFINDYKDGKNPKGLYLYGIFGCGKTYLLSAIANRLASLNISSLLIYFPDLSRELKNAIGTPRFDELLNTLKTVDVLMLDDFGAENLTSWLRDDIIGPIINYRFQDNKPIMISTNLNIKELMDHFAHTQDGPDDMKAGRIISRIKSMVNIINM